MASSRCEMIRELKGYDVNTALSYITRMQATINRNPVTVFRDVKKSENNSVDIVKYLDENKPVKVNNEKLLKVQDNVLEIISSSKNSNENRKILMSEKNLYLIQKEHESEREFTEKVVEKVFQDAISENSNSYYGRDSTIAPNNKSFLETESSAIHPKNDINIVEGVNKSMWYVGGPGSITSLHVEDGDFASMNLLLKGEDKIWGFIEKKEFLQLGQKVKNYLNFEKECIIFHKPGFIIHPVLLKEWGINMQYLVQKAGDLVYVSEATMHFVVNMGLNIAEAINFATPASTIKSAITFCNCSEKDIGRIKRSQFVFKKIDKSKIRESKKITYTCENDDCDKVFLYKQSYNEHMYDVHGQLSIPCRSSDCNKKFRSRQSELEHFKNTHHRSASKVQCSQCSNNFVNASALKRHVKETHGNQVKEKCDKCDQKMLKRNLAAHTKSCNGKIKCNKCERLFSRKQSLMLHNKHCNGNSDN